MAIKKGNVRLQVTIGEGDMSDLNELCELWHMSKSATVKLAIWNSLVDARIEAVQERKEEREAQGQ